MKSNHIKFDFSKSLERIDDILFTDTSYEDADDVPDVSELTYKNGKYVNCSAIFIDLRGSSDLIETHGKKSKSLARIYRCYISEMVAIVNGFQTCREINIIGDCVSAIFSGKADDGSTHISQILQASSMAHGMMQVLNAKFKRKWNDFESLLSGIGIAEGRALVIKAGYSGSKINDLIYMGDVVNKASKMCSLAYKEYKLSAICVTEKVYTSSSKVKANGEQTFSELFSLNIHNKFGKVYTANYWAIEYANWAKENS